jgi:RNA polymerase-binding transcription factor DksA
MAVLTDGGPLCGVGGDDSGGRSKAEAAVLTWVKALPMCVVHHYKVVWWKRMQDMATTRLAVRKAMLEGRLIELGERLEAIEEELDSHHNPDWEDLATEREGDEVLEATGNAGLTEISQIRAALRRIEDGTYGQCVRCGEDIAEPRLDAIPWTPLCRRCAT